ncbi:hypothetical protein PO124_27640 [Bacillus licheniformis]|nr:hypothetical protein [Bacillus licheniformis]
MMETRRCRLTFRPAKANAGVPLSGETVTSLALITIIYKSAITRLKQGFAIKAIRSSTSS